VHEYRPSSFGCDGNINGASGKCVGPKFDTSSLLSALTAAYVLWNRENRENLERTLTSVVLFFGDQEGLGL
jgi:hypothetical protein